MAEFFSQSFSTFYAVSNAADKLGLWDWGVSPMFGTGVMDMAVGSGVLAPPEAAAASPDPDFCEEEIRILVWGADLSGIMSLYYWDSWLSVKTLPAFGRPKFVLLLTGTNVAVSCPAAFTSSWAAVPTGGFGGRCC